MKRVLLIGLLTFVASTVYAQSDAEVSSPRMQPLQTYDGFLLDFNVATPTEPVHPLAKSLQALMPDYSQLLFPQQPSMTYGTLNSNLLMPSYTLGTIGATYMHGIPTTGNIQVANFKLKNGMTISTMGDYDAQGSRVNRPVLPWQRNNFQGAFQLKTSDGKFGISIHVSNGAGPY